MSSGKISTFNKLSVSQLCLCVQHLTDKVNMNGSSASILSQLKTPRVYLDVWDWRRYLPPLRKHTGIGKPMHSHIILVFYIILHLVIQF